MHREAVEHVNHVQSGDTVLGMIRKRNAAGPVVPVCTQELAKQLDLQITALAARLARRLDSINQSLVGRRRTRNAQHALRGTTALGTN